jgi:hypothetical protein
MPHPRRDPREEVITMGWLSQQPRVPDTIGRKRGEQLRRQGAKADIWLSPKAVKQRKAREEQRKKSAWS